MSLSKKAVRKTFREVVFKRDGHKCVCCFKTEELDAHHITDRNFFENGGYVLANGISLCSDCHLKAEEFHCTGVSYVGYSPEDLYRKINSSFDKAKKEDCKDG